MFIVVCVECNENWKLAFFALELQVVDFEQRYGLLPCVNLSRSDQWWNYIVLQTYSPSDWIGNFRMSQQTFNYICQQLTPVIKRQNTRMRKAIPVQKRVGIIIWCLATSVEYRTFGHLLALQGALFVEYRNLLFFHCGNIFGQDLLSENLLHEYYSGTKTFLR